MNLHLFLNITLVTAVIYFAKQAEGRPRAFLTVDPRVSEVFIGEPITLCCAIRGSEENSSWKYTWKKQENQEVLLLLNGEDTSEFTLKNSEEADSIYYWCEANNGNTMIQSNHHKLKVTARPEAVLVLESRWTTVFPTERVTLRCDIHSSITGWSYEWLKDDQLLDKTGDRNRYISTASAQSESGHYTCRGHLMTRAVNSKISSPIALWVKGGRPKPVITQDPLGAEVHTGERVTLSCGFGGDPAGWEYLWYKDTQGAALHNTDSSRTDGSSYTISSAALTHSGQYWCRAARGKGPFYSEYSDSLILKISALPKAQLSVQSGWTEVFPTERVTLRCEIQGSSTEWMYRWYRDGQELPVDKADSSSGNGDTYTILSADQSHTGLYTCRGDRTRRPDQSTVSSAVKLNVSRKIPKPIITQDPPGAEVYTGERVTLSCGFGGDPAGWEYLWYKDTQGAALPNTDSSRTDGSSYTISSAALSHSGEYWCRAARGTQTFHSHYSDTLTLNIYAPPQAELSVQSGWTEIFPTERVTLRCEIQGSSTEWMYRWYRDGQELPVDKADSSSGNGDTYTILSADQSHTGLYTCRGDRTRRPDQSIVSNPVKLSVTNKKPKPVITQDPPGAGVYTGERVTLSCGFGGDPAGWEYLWYKDTQGAALPNTDSSRTDGSSYTISSAALTHSGEYCCRAMRGRDTFHSNYSDILVLNISAHPQAVVTMETRWTEIFTSGSVTLRCEVKGISAEWNYTWYRDGEQIPLDHPGERLTVGSSDSYQSEYKCRGNRAEKPTYSSISDGVVPAEQIYRPVENLVRICVGVAILIFLSVIVSDSFWRRARRARMCCTVTVTCRMRGEEDG